MNPTVRDMINANVVIAKLADNPNLFVTTSFKLLPLLEFLTGVVEDYNKHKEEIIAQDLSLEEKEAALTEYLEKDVEIPDIEIAVNSFRNCGLTLIDVKHISWWLVEFIAEEFED